MARRRNRSGQFTRGRAHTPRRRRRARARRNPAIPFYNPRRRRARSRSRTRARRNAAIPFYNPRRRRRHYRRNPGIGGMFKGILPPLDQISFGVVGCAGKRVIERQVIDRFLGGALPDVATKAIAAAATGILGRMLLGKKNGNHVAVGAFICLADELAAQYVYPMVPGLDAYLDPGVGAYLDPDAIGQYLNPGATLPMLPGGDGDMGGYLAGDNDVARLDSNKRL